MMQGTGRRQNNKRGENMPETFYKEDEVYLTTEAVNNTRTGVDKAAMVYNLIKRLQENGRAIYTPEVEAILSRCADELKPISW